MSSTSQRLHPIGQTQPWTPDLVVSYEVEAVYRAVSGYSDKQKLIFISSYILTKMQSYILCYRNSMSWKLCKYCQHQLLQWIIAHPLIRTLSTDYNLKVYELINCAQAIGLDNNSRLAGRDWFKSNFHTVQLTSHSFTYYGEKCLQNIYFPPLSNTFTAQ